MADRSDITGKLFGLLTVVERVPNPKNSQSLWKCRCKCGNTTFVLKSHLKNGDTVSCGCYRRNRMKKDKHTIHGICIDGNQNANRIYHIWNGMLSRCYNQKSHDWERYGGKGITICTEWKNDFPCFYKWAMANGYKSNLSIDRKDNSKGYSPNNCRWSTSKEQANNRSNNILFEVKGEIVTLAQLAEREKTTREIAEKNHKEEKIHG